MLGPLMIDLEGTSLTAQEIDLIQHPWVGGIIFFTRNYCGVSVLRDLIDQIRARRPELILAVDQEGGRVQRFREGFTILPPLADFGKQYEVDPKQALVAAKLSASLMAKELTDLGIDLSFAPVLDLDLGKSTVIGDRAFHGDPKVVATLAMAYQEGMAACGMVAVGKHFPGHGSVVADSHLELPEDHRTLEELTEDLLPFKHFIQNAGQALMMAHIVYPKIDAYPVGFSKVWLQTILRQQLGFEGVIISDDLSMKGAVGIGSLSRRTEIALEAGCDLTLLCNDRVGILATLAAFEAKSPPLNHRLQILKSTAKPMETCL